MNRAPFNRWLIVPALCLVLVASASAQEHPFIAQYALTELPGAIRIDWTIQGGNTCNGQEVERSTDGITFARVHRIDGICGNTSAPVPYHWFDNAPPEFSTVYYRVKLGIDGYTSVKSIHFRQLTTSEQRLFPNPVTDAATLVVNASATSAIDVRITDASGREVMLITGVQGQAITIDARALVPGLYSYTAVAGGRTFQGRFIKL